MADDVNFKPSWDDAATQCQNCKQFQQQDGKSACVPPDKNFEEALEAYGEVPPQGHCDYFTAK